MTNNEELKDIIKEFADCGCSFDPLYKRARELLMA